MIEPTEADIGRRVIYKPDNNGPNDYGVVMSFNDNLVFVRYEGTGNQRQGTSRCMLHWTGASTADLIAEIARLLAKLGTADSNELAKASKLIHICITREVWGEFTVPICIADRFLILDECTIETPVRDAPPKTDESGLPLYEEYKTIEHTGEVIITIRGRKTDRTFELN